MDVMDIKAKPKKSKTGIALVVLSFLITIMLFLIGWTTYSVFYQTHWNYIETEVPVKNENPELNENESWNSEPELYSEKYDEAKAKIGNLAMSDYFVVVDISEQKEYVFTKEGVFEKIYRVSTGSTRVKVGTEVNAEGVTVPVYEDRSMGPSIWRVSEKQDSGLSPIYGPRLMMLDRLIKGRWTPTEVALHGTDQPELLGSPQSIGCVNHDNADIIELYDMLSVGTLVVSIN